MNIRPRLYNNSVEVKDFFSSLSRPHNYTEVDGSFVHVKEPVCSINTKIYNAPIMIYNPIVATLQFRDNLEAMTFSALFDADYNSYSYNLNNPLLPGLEY